MKRNPQFFENWPDNNHCLQASVKMALASLGKQLSWEEINRITDYADNLYSWTPRTVVSLASIIPEILLISSLDYCEFAKTGEKYYKNLLKDNPSWFETQRQCASPKFLKEQKAAKELTKLKLYQQKNLTLKDFEDLLINNSLIALVDPGQLEGRANYKGHFVFIYHQNENLFYLHDPGLPPKKVFKVNKKNFIKAYRGELIIIPRTISH